MNSYAATLAAMQIAAQDREILRRDRELLASQARILAARAAEHAAGQPGYVAPRHPRLAGVGRLLRHAAMAR